MRVVTEATQHVLRNSCLAGQKGGTKRLGHLGILGTRDGKLERSPPRNCEDAEREWTLLAPKKRVNWTTAPLPGNPAVVSRLALAP